MEFEIIQRSKYEFDVYEHVNRSNCLYLSKVQNLNLATAVCNQRMIDTKQTGLIKQVLIKN